LYEKCDNLNPESSRKHGFFPRIISRKTISTEELCKRAAEGTTFSAFELETAVKMLIDGILNELGEGNNVCIDNFGTFSVSAEATREAHRQRGIRAESIRLKRIVFKMSKPLLKRLHFTFQRLPDKE
jgi:predicted histone-like DNA-binding protein